MFSIARRRFWGELLILLTYKHKHCLPWMRWGISRLRTGQLTWFRHRDGQGWYHWWTHTKREFQWLRRSFLLGLWRYKKERGGYMYVDICWRFRIEKRNILPKNLVLDLKLQFWFESLGSIRPECADFEKSRWGQSFIQLREIMNTTSMKMWS